MQQLLFQLLTALSGKFRFPHKRIRRYLIISFILIIITLFMIDLFPYFWDRLHIPLWRYVPIWKNSVVWNISFTWNFNPQIPTPRRGRSATFTYLFNFFMWLRKSYKSRTYWLVTIFLLIPLSHHILIFALNILILNLMRSFFSFFSVQSE